jgi:Crinkler effector protein N-terminal domain
MDSNLSDLFQSGKQSIAVRPINCSIVGSDDQFKLWCWILNKSDKYFSVKIGKGETIDDLKEAIKNKEEPELDHLAAGSLLLWKVSLSYWRVSMRISDILEAISTHSFF